ncbi:helicase MOV-10 [Spea bombifrons]|uniref:helicase MOV-10 n=1 Tax=Spea bombifrons TaxID=233779 RepID=UPI00234B5766|nr:helicase MOV-10 [Spea bombifrons]
MPKFTVKELRCWGEKFLQYLTDTGRENVGDKEELRRIYSEFKNRDDQRKPSFSAAVYGLRVGRKVLVTSNSITFNQLVTKPVLLTDQYVAERRDRKQEFLSVPLSGNGVNCSKGQARKIIRWMKQNRSKFIGDNVEIAIDSDYDLNEGKIRIKLAPNEPQTFPIRIKNNSHNPVTLVQYKVLRRMKVFSFTDDFSVSKSKPLVLKPGDIYHIHVRCSTAYYGYFPVTMVFEFLRESDAPNGFFIGRFLSVVSNSRLYDDLAPTSSYVPYQRDLLKPTVRTEDEGFPPDNSLKYELERKIPLGDSTPPNHLRNSIRAGVFSKTGPRTVFPADAQDRNLLSSALNFSNYDKRFSLLLHLEEIQMEIDIRKYDKTGEQMECDPRNKRLLLLHVPGVAESRPSVLRGDHLFVCLSDERTNPAAINYKGYVHGVELEKVRLGFSVNLLKRFVTGLKFDVMFTFNRLPLKVQHRAVSLAKSSNIEQFLFPTSSYGQAVTDTERLTLYDRSLETNKEQYNAVKQIVGGLSRPAPYLIFGPPGTGKTVTLVEAIKQVLKCIPTSHVLACAPSNSAADLICQRLMKHVDKKGIYRILASSREFRTVPEDIKPCCNWDDGQGCYVYPCKDKLKTYRVIITTLTTAGRLVSADFPKDHFSHVFIDESGHAVEPECVIAIAGLLNVMNPQSKGGQLVLAGDPKQLGPILRSPLAIEHGLDKSLLERLMTENSLYQKNNQGYNSQFVTKLLKNYRSHPSILKIPNELFYDNELQPCADQLLSNSYCSWEKLPRKGFPIIFHGVMGKDEREGNSPSFFNRNEIDALLSYLTALLETQGRNGLAKISPKDIGIISPYRKQVEKIRKAIDLQFKGVSDIKDLKVGSVEEFQGQERKVIIISTVRSTKDYVKFDEDFSLGFLKNPKRFNVAITRAKALLIVVGNPIILCKDPNWSAFLKYCTDAGGYTGNRLDDCDDLLNDEELTELFSGLDVNEPPAGQDTGESFVQQHVDPGWRSDI